MRSLLITYAALVASATVQARAAECLALKSVALNHAVISTAEIVSAGRFTPPYSGSLEQMPAFCRVAGIIAPSNDSHINFEVWLPQAGWNQKFLGVGNGGFAGSIDFQAMGGNVKRGYATAATDTGHEAGGTDASWAYGHPEKVADFGYRAIHETAIAAKALLKVYYAREPQHSYFDSCSNGGREALMEAQRFPGDYDGILAGAPANYWTHLASGGVDFARTVVGDPAAYLSPVKFHAITAAVLASCDSQSGVKQAYVNDPIRCGFNPDVLLCKGSESRSCLTPPQLRSLKKIYGGPKTEQGEQVFPGFTPGSEDGPGAWSAWISGDAPGGSIGMAFLENYLRYMVYSDPALNVLTAGVKESVERADKGTAKVLNATDPDLRPFQKHGGRLILYHGWNDPAISPFNTINYYNSVKARIGSDVSKFVQLYMAPGVQHCAGGPGPSAFGQLGIATSKGSRYGLYDALENWVEQGRAPGEIIATKYANDNPSGTVVMTRPLCPYPLTATYKGSGDVSEATSFVCAAAGQ